MEQARCVDHEEKGMVYVYADGERKPDFFNYLFFHGIFIRGAGGGVRHHTLCTVSTRQKLE